MIQTSLCQVPRFSFSRYNSSVTTSGEGAFEPQSLYIGDQAMPLKYKALSSQENLKIHYPTVSPAQPWMKFRTPIIIAHLLLKTHYHKIKTKNSVLLQTYFSTLHLQAITVNSIRTWNSSCCLIEKTLALNKNW